jgi:predicted  nucleic acid-binding Zn-ribbon protein
MMYKCLECGRKFRTTRSAERAANKGCPGCGGVDIDVDVEVAARSKNPPDADQYARVRKMTRGQIMRAEREAATLPPSSRPECDRGYPFG